LIFARRLSEKALTMIKDAAAVENPPIISKVIIQSAAKQVLCLQGRPKEKGGISSASV
jgi:hypothetical protein